MAKKSTGNSTGAEQLIRDLKNKAPARCYIIYGEEEGTRSIDIQEM